MEFIYNLQSCEPKTSRAENEPTVRRSSASTISRSDRFITGNRPQSCFLTVMRGCTINNRLPSSNYEKLPPKQSLLVDDGYSKIDEGKMIRIAPAATDN